MYLMARVAAVEVLPLRQVVTPHAGFAFSYVFFFFLAKNGGACK
jgi:hypothetical protein